MTREDVLIDLQGIAKHYGEGETRVDALRVGEADAVPVDAGLAGESVGHPDPDEVAGARPHYPV